MKHGTHNHFGVKITTIYKMKALVARANLRVCIRGWICHGKRNKGGGAYEFEDGHGHGHKNLTGNDQWFSKKPKVSVNQIGVLESCKPMPLVLGEIPVIISPALLLRVPHSRSVPFPRCNVGNARGG